VIIGGTLLPQVADTFRLTETEAMGPRLRGDDGGACFYAAVLSPTVSTPRLI
jgi:hypothetical protein